MRNARGELFIGPLGTALGSRAPAVLGTLAEVVGGEGRRLPWDEARAPVPSPVAPMPLLFATGWDFFAHQIRRALRDVIERPSHMLSPILLPVPLDAPVHVPIDGEPPVAGSLAAAAEELQLLRESYRIRFDTLVREQPLDRRADVESRDGRTDLMLTLIKVCSQGVNAAVREGLPLTRR